MAVVGSPSLICGFSGPGLLSRFPLPGMIFLLLSGFDVQLESCWLLTRHSCHYCTLRFVVLCVVMVNMFSRIAGCFPFFWKLAWNLLVLWKLVFKEIFRASGLSVSSDPVLHATLPFHSPGLWSYFRLWTHIWRFSDRSLRRERMWDFSLSGSFLHSSFNQIVPGERCLSSFFRGTCQW